MSFNKSGFSSMVYKHLRKPVLIAGVLIGGASVFAGAAKADLHVSSCHFTSDGTECIGPSGIGWVTTPVIPGDPPIQLGDKLLNVVGYSFRDFSQGIGTPAPSGHIEFSWNDPNNDGIPNYRDDLWNIRTVFDNPVTGDLALGNATGVLNYTLTVTDPNWQFANIELDSGHIGTGVTVTKVIAGLTPSPYLTSIEGVLSNAPLSGTFANVTDTYSVTASGGLVVFNNSFTQTPAPLPILGVGAVFGSIRKLRRFSSRLKTFSMG